MKNGVSTEVKAVPPEVTFEGQGLGTCRSSGAMIALLLQMESPGDRAGIITFAAKELGLSLEDLTDAYTDYGCPMCGISMVAHKRNGGNCF